MFRSATFRLTAWYLVIIMSLSLAFSFLLYRALSRELETGFTRQGVRLRQLPPGQVFGFIDGETLRRLQEEQLAESRRRVQLQLLNVNLLVFLLGGFASYALARRTLQPIEDAHEAQVRFTADASHELRTPLTSMRTEIEVALRNKELTLQEAKGLLSSNIEEIGKLESLSSALLTLAKAGNEDEKPAFDACSVADILSSAVGRVRQSAGERKVVVESPAASLKVEGECDTLVELITILLDNAIKYSPDKSTIELSAGIKGDQVEIRVKDEGAGIKASDLPYIFNRFYRADTSRSKKQVAGYGLGLSIARQIVERHQGEIKVASTIQKGSTFTVLLPQAHSTAS